jgi:UDP-N-acetylmuramoyl-tripeptide--D-alanyl-D-alanine ligase
MKLIALLKTPAGRIQLLYRFFLMSWPIFSYTMSLYRKTILRKTKIVVAVGSFGKTTTTRAVGVALKSKVYGFNQRDPWRFASRTFLRPWVFDPYIVLEVRIISKNEMADYARILRPDIVIVTSIGSEHNRSLETLEVTRSEKAEMLRVLPESAIALLNGDDPNVLWMKSQTCARVITFGMNEINDVRASDIRLDWPEGTRFTLHLDGKAHDMKVRLVGRHMVYPVLAAAALAHAEGFHTDHFLQSLEELTPTPGRIQPVHLENGAIILRDEFKSSLETIETALDVLSEIPAERKIVVLGEVSEPPGSQGPIYRKLGERIAKIAGHVIIIGKKRGFENYRSGASRISGVSGTLFTYAGKDVLDAVGILQNILAPGDVVLTKGRGNQRLERIALALTGRTVRCNISSCGAWVRCESCPMLELGWNGLDVVL